jgi:hypothetical protein
MNLSDLLFLLASLVVVSEMLWAQALEPVYLPVLVLVMAGSVVRFRGPLPPWALSVFIGAVFATVALLFAGRSSINQGWLALWLLILTGALFAGTLRARYQILISVGFLPALGLAYFLQSPVVDSRVLPAVQLTLWPLAAWPFISLFVRGRSWASVAMLGSVPIVVLSLGLLELGRATPGTAIDVLRWGWLHVDLTVLLVQTLLVGASTMPLLVEAGLYWRWLCSLGLASVVGCLILVETTGPWAGTWPMAINVAMAVAICSAVAGLIGMLCTIRRPNLLSDIAVRAAALGIAASAVRLLVDYEQAPTGGELVPAVAKALAPAVVGYGLAAIMVTAGLIARRRGAAPLATTNIRQGWARVRSSLISSVADTFEGFSRHSRFDIRAWFGPQRAVPILIFLAAWPAILELGTVQAVVWLLPLSLATLSLVQYKVILWALFHTLIVGGAGLALDAPLVLMPAFAAIGLFCAWPYFRWPQLDPAWAYPTSLLVLAPLWMALPGLEPALVCLAVGTSILLGNALRRGPARWFLISGSLLLMGTWLRYWVPEVDPYTPVVFDELTFYGELEHLLLRLPAPTLLLLTMWGASRHGLRHLKARVGSGRATRWWIVSAVVIATGVFWGLGLRPGWPLAIFQWVAVGFAAPLAAAELVDMRRADYRHPFTTGLALALVVVVCSTATAVGLEVAGAMGQVLLNGSRDVMAIATAIPIVLGLRLILVHGSELLPTTLISRMDSLRSRLTTPSGMRKNGG